MSKTASKRIGHRKRLSASRLNGFALVAKGGMIERITDKKFEVQTKAGKFQAVTWERDEWNCECLDFRETGKPCEHIFAVLYLLELPNIMLANSAGLERLCPDCGSNDIVREGTRKNLGGVVQTFSCNDCHHKFSQGSAIGIKRGNAMLMVLTTDLYYKGLSVRAVANHIWQVYNVRKSPSTLHRWVLRLTRIVVDATKGITPAVGTRWLGDEMVIKVKGRKSYLWNVLDYRTRYHIAAIVAEGRSHQEAYEVIQKAISKGGITPNQFVSDGLPSYKKGIQMTGKKIKHISGVGIQNHPNNNRIERRHGSMRGWIRNKRGLKGRTQEVIDGSLVYYNYLRPHQGLKNRPPSPTFEGDKWTSVLSGRRRRSRSSGA